MEKEIKERKASKQNKGIFGTLCILLIMLLLTGAGGYTYARYMSQERGTGSADIANWSFKIVKDGEETKSVTLRNAISKSTLVNGKIAPGTSGEFTITLDANGSEVAVEYILAFTNEQNKPNNIVFTYNGNNYKSLSEIGDIKGIIGITGERAKTIKIAWAWLYQTGTTDEAKLANDEIDTRDGTSLLDYTFDIVAKGVQT